VNRVIEKVLAVNTVKKKSKDIVRKEKIINSVYEILLNTYGGQGWWPIADVSAGKSVYSHGRVVDNYERLEIVYGAILTQNTTWKNAEKALLSLKRNGLIDPVKIFMTDIEKLAGLIRSSGYYNQKARKIHDFISWFKKYDYSFDALLAMGIDELRRELLSVKGIGNETADSIILYSLEKKIFVVDAYTVRIFGRTGLLSGREKYHEVQDLFHRYFEGDTGAYNQYHALIVKHAKEVCIPARSKRVLPSCGECPINFLCKKLIS
jgi:endonuclease-3 related protein